MSNHSLLKSVLCVAILFIGKVQAVTIVVNGIDGTVANDGVCSISEAIQAANTDIPVDTCPAGGIGLDTIELPFDIFLTEAFQNNTLGSTGTPAITSEIILDGQGFSISRIGACTINGTNASTEYRIMRVGTAGNLTLKNITLSNGCADGTGIKNAGGAILNRTNLSVENTTFSGNSADRGAGIYNDDTLSFVQGSTFSGNNAATSGGGIENNETITTIENSTFSGNIANTGAGIYNSNTITTIQNSTFSGNTAGSGGGIYNDGPIGALSNSIFHQNQNSDSVCSYGNNGSISGSNNISDGDLLLNDCPDVSELTTSTIGPLADNGGPTMTHALLPGSEAIDASGGSPTITDQRGFAAVGIRDIGAFEFRPIDVCPLSLQADGFTTSVANSVELNLAIECANLNGSTNGGDTINLSNKITLFTPYGNNNGFGGTGTEVIKSTIVLNGMGFSLERDDSLTCNLNNSIEIGEFRLLRINVQGDLTLNNITLSNGCADGTNNARSGGAVFNNGVLSLENTVISGNLANFNAGGIYNSNSITTIQNSTFSGNSTGAGGAIFNDSTISTIQNSTFSGNSAVGNGGGIYNSNTITTIENSTFSGNSAIIDGAGIRNFDGTITTLRNSLFHQNTGGGTECANGGTGSINGTNNLSDNLLGGCPGVSTLTTSSVGPLADNGGPTMTHALLLGSEAIDAGDGDSTTTDQRGNDAFGPRDIGAYEAATLTEICPIALQTDGFTTSVGNSSELNQAIVCANLNGSATDTINLSTDITLTAALENNVFGSTGTQVVSNSIIVDGMGFTLMRDGTCSINGSNDATEYRIMRIDNSGDLTLKNITLSNGCADGSGESKHGGALLNDGELFVANSIFTGNAALNGGGIYNNNLITTISNSTFITNSADSRGGGVHNSSNMTTIQNSTFSGNSAETSGAGIYNTGSIVTIQNNTLSGNSTDTNGGGIGNNGTITTIQNNTFSANTANFNGGGIYNSNTITTIGNSTFSGNSAVFEGAGIRNFNGTIDTLRNSLFHNNISAGPECSNNGTTFNGSNNLSDDATSGCPNVSITLDPSTIGLLADNGGPAWTHALLPGSQAIDTGDGDSTTTDQRGFTASNTRDIGAFEAFTPVVVAPIDDTFEATGPLTSPSLGIATVTDVDESGLIAIASSADNFAVGMTTVTWTSTDAYGFIGTDSQVVTIVDTTEPVISLTGANPQIFQETENYTELGATATDLVNDDTALTATIVIDDSDVDTDVPGMYEVTYNVMDTAGNVADTVIRDVEVTADIPVTNNDSYDTDEDVVLNSVGSVLTNDNDPDNDGLTVVTTGDSTMTGMGGSINLSANGTFVYTPVGDVSGTDVLNYEVTDGTHTVSSTITIAVNPVNDAPTFSVMGDVDVTGLVDVINDFVEVPDFIENIVLGPADESGQSIGSITAVAVDPDNVISAVSINNNGLLRVDINIGNYGAAIVQVQLKDDGGTGNNGEDTSEIVEFMVIYDDLIFGNGFEDAPDIPQ